MGFARSEFFPCLIALKANGFMDFQRWSFVQNLFDKLFQKRPNCHICGRSTRKDKKFSGLVAGYSRFSCFQLFCCFWCDIASLTLLRLRQTFVCGCVSRIWALNIVHLLHIASRLLPNSRVTTPTLILLKLRNVPKVRSAVLPLFKHALSGYIFCSFSICLVTTSTCCCFFRVALPKDIQFPLKK